MTDYDLEQNEFDEAIAYEQYAAGEACTLSQYVFFTDRDLGNIGSDRLASVRYSSRMAYC